MRQTDGKSQNLFCREKPQGFGCYHALVLSVCWLMRFLRMFSVMAMFALVSTSWADLPDEKFIYKKVGGRELSLYVSKPTDWKPTDKRPALVFFHGGGWLGGKPSLFDQHCHYFASRGLVCATVEYRLLNKTNNESPLACVQDAQSALRWVRSHALELGIDPARIGAGGGSAGGHLAAFCGMVSGQDDPQDDLHISPKPQALVLFNPVFNNGPGQWGHARVGQSYREFSPAHNISADDPPTVIFLGSEDAVISVETTKDFQTQLQKLGVKCDLHVYAGQKHGFYGKGNPQYFYETVTTADRFLATLGWLKGPPTLEKPPQKPTVEKKK